MGDNAQACDEMDDERFSDLSTREREDSLTRAFCLGEIDVLERGRELGIVRRRLDAWFISLALRDSSERSIRWLLAGTDLNLAPQNGDGFWTELNGHAARASCWANNAVLILEEILAPKFGDCKWVEFCQKSTELNPIYWDELFQRNPWTALLGGAPIAKGKIGEFRSWSDLMAALGEGEQTEAAAAASTVSALMSELPHPSEIQVDEVFGDILREASRRLFNGKGLSPIKKSLLLLPPKNIKMSHIARDREDPMSWDVLSGYARKESSLWRHGRGRLDANLGFLALALGSQDDLEFAISQGWISDFFLATPEGNAPSSFQASPINALLLCRADSVQIENQKWSDGKSFGKFKALQGAGFRFDSGEFSRQALGDSMAALARWPEINALWEKEQLSAPPCMDESSRRPMRL